jgi:hypothetical protein
MPVTHRIQRQKKSKVTKQQRKVNKKCKSCKNKGGYNQPYAVQFHPQHAQHAQNQQQYNLFATQLQQHPFMFDPKQAHGVVGMPHAAQLQQHQFMFDPKQAHGVVGMPHVTQLQQHQFMYQNAMLSPYPNNSHYNLYEIPLPLQQPLPENETEHQIDPNVQIPSANKKYEDLMSIQKQFVELIKPMIIRETITTNEYTTLSAVKTIFKGNKEVNLKKTQIKENVSTNIVSELFKKIQQCEIKRKGNYTNKTVGNTILRVFEYDNSPQVRNDLRNSVFQLRKFEKSLGEIIDVFDQQISPNSLKLWYSKREQYEITAYERLKYGFRNLLGLNNNRPIKPMLFKNFKLLNITIQNAINLLNKAGAIIKTHVEENVKRETAQKKTPLSSYLLLKQGREFNRIVKTSHYTILYFCYEVYSDIALKIIMNEEYTSPSQKHYQEPNLNKLPTMQQDNRNNYHHNPTHSDYSGTSPTANNDTSIPYDTNFPMGQSNGLHDIYYIPNNQQPHGNNTSEQAGVLSVLGDQETKTYGGRRKPVRKNNKKPDIKKSKPRRNNKVRIN